MQQHYHLESLHNQIALAISINDILVFSDRYHSMPNNQVSINQWVYKGINTIDIYISVNPHFEHQMREQKAMIKIVEYTGNKPDFISHTIKEFIWNYVPDQTKFPIILHDTFSLDIPYGDWSWQSCEPLSMDVISWESLKIFITQLHSALSTKDYSNLEPLLKTKASELARAYYIPIDERLNDQKEFFNELFSQSSWVMQPLDFSNIEVQFFAQGKLLEITDKKGQSLLKSGDLNGDTFSIPLRVAFKNNQWILCR